MERSQIIVRTSIIGIAVNLVLVLFKMMVGLLSNSIAVILDAVNNLGDALSSIITIVGIRLAGKAPDKEHPYGYGRIEYLSSVLVAAIVLTAGITSMKESVLKIVHPEPASYSAVSLVIIAVAAAAKFLCGRYVKSVGERINAQSLVAAGSDAFFDSILSLGTLGAAVVSMVWGITLEGILGALISVIIIRAGMEMLLETLDSIIGTRADRELTMELKAKIRTFEGVQGAYDLTLHNYGPGETMGSVHVEVDDSFGAREIHRLSHRISEKIFEEYGILLTVGIYASNTSDPQVVAMREQVHEVVIRHPEILQMHAFYVEFDTKLCTFDVVINFKVDAQQVKQEVLQELAKVFPDYHFHIRIDSDFSD